MKDVMAYLMAQIACADAVESNFVSLTKTEAKLILKLLKEQDSIISVLKSDLEETLEVVAERSNVVRCKDCIHRGKSEKCVLTAISEEKDYPLFMLDNRGEWFCADGKHKDT